MSKSAVPPTPRVGWLDQWDRVNRYLDRLRLVAEPRRYNAKWAWDDGHAFFQNCHHLKDWLGNDPRSGYTLTQGDTLINNHNALRLCADVCNGSKHLALVDSKGRKLTRTGDLSTYLRPSMNIVPGRGVGMTFCIRSGGHDSDAMEVATDAVNIWTSELQTHGLLT